MGPLAPEDAADAAGEDPDFLLDFDDFVADATAPLPLPPPPPPPPLAFAVAPAAIGGWCEAVLKQCSFWGPQRVSCEPKSARVRSQN